MNNSAIAVSPRTLHSEERGRINETNYHYSIMSPPILVTKSNQGVYFPVSTVILPWQRMLVEITDHCQVTFLKTNNEKYQFDDGCGCVYIPCSGFLDQAFAIELSTSHPQEIDHNNCVGNHTDFLALSFLALSKLGLRAFGWSPSF